MAGKWSLSICVSSAPKASAAWFIWTMLILYPEATNKFPKNISYAFISLVHTQMKAQNSISWIE